MHTWKSSVPVACAIALLIASNPAAAQTADPAPSTQSPPSSSAPAQAKPDAAVAPIRGELIDVDAEARTFTILTASQTKVVFSYNDATQVSGAKEGVAGLATMKNAQVAVHFSEDAAKKTRTATRIEVQPKAATAPAQSPEANPMPADPAPR